MAPLWHCSFLVLVLDGCRCWVLCHGRFTPPNNGHRERVGCSGFLGRREKSLPPLGIETQSSCRPTRNIHPPISRLRDAENNVFFLNANSRVVQTVGSEPETNWLVFSLLDLTL